MSKANPSVPERLDNPELARDIRALATRIEEQAHRYTLERRTNNLAALFTVGLAFNNLARDLRLIADHVQPASTPGAGGRPSSGAPAVGDGQVLRRSTPAANECGGTLAYEVMGVMGGAIRVHRDGVYRTRCQKCGDEGTNDGTARTCTRAWRLYSTFSPSGARLETDGARWRFTHDGAVISEGADEGAVVTAGLSSLDEARG